MLQGTFNGVMMQFIKFVAIILAIFAPIVLMFVGPDMFWLSFALWIGGLLIVIPILFLRYFR